MSGLVAGLILSFSLFPEKEIVVYEESPRGFESKKVEPTPNPVIKTEYVEVIKEVKSIDENLLKEVERLNKELIGKNNPSPTPVTSPSPTPTLIPTPTPEIPPTPKIENCRNDIEDGVYEQRQGLTQVFGMPYYGKPINREDYIWFTAWGNPSEGNGALFSTTFNSYGKHLVKLTDKWGRVAECWVNIYE